MTHNVFVRARPLAVALGLSLLLTLASGQIVLDRSDVPETVGDSFTYKYTTSLTTISVGDPGGPQTWEFDTATYVGALTMLGIVDPTTTPLQAEFPTANLVHRCGPPGSTIYSLVFHELQDAEMVRLGTGQVRPDTAIAVVYDPVMLVNPLPLHYEEEWLASFGSTNYSGPLRIILYTWGMPKADAWGTVTVPAGTFDCLRVNSYDTTTTETWLGDSLFHADTTGYRTMYWVAPHRGIVVFATGPEGDTSSHFTQTDCYRVMVAAGTGVAEWRSATGRQGALSVSPNPFAGRVNFNLAAAGPGPVTVRLHDRAGRLVRELQGEADARGECRLVWDGCDQAGARLAPGVYFGSRADAPKPVKVILAD